MTIHGAIEQVDILCPNMISTEQKIKWLSLLDVRVFREIVLTHEDAPVDENNEIIYFAGYNGEVDEETVLLVPDDFADIYRYYLEAKICQSNNEIKRYNNAMMSYNTEWVNYQNYYNRTHMPVQKAGYFKFYEPQKRNWFTGV